MTNIEDRIVNDTQDEISDREEAQTGLALKVEGASMAGGFAVVSDTTRSQLEAELLSLGDSNSGHARSRRSEIKRQLGMVSDPELEFAD